MTTMVWVYLCYLAICVTVTILVARTLRVHGATFISGKDSDPSPIVQAKTHLLVVGFYLVCLGLIGFTLRYGGHADDTTTAIELVSTKIGGMIFVIGFLHFSMVGIFASTKAENSKPAFIADTTRN